MPLSPIADVAIKRTITENQRPDLVKVYSSTQTQNLAALGVLSLYGVSPKYFARRDSIIVIQAEINPQYATATVIDEIETAVQTADPAATIIKPS